MFCHGCIAACLLPNGPAECCLTGADTDVGLVLGLVLKLMLVLVLGLLLGLLLQLLLVVLLGLT